MRTEGCQIETGELLGEDSNHMLMHTVLRTYMHGHTHTQIAGRIPYAHVLACVCVRTVIVGLFRFVTDSVISVMCHNDDIVWFKQQNAIVVIS